MHTHSHHHSHAGSHGDQADSHGHDHHDHSAVDFQNVNFSFVIAVGANLIFTIIEAAYGLITGSVSLLADAGHNLSDVLGLLLAWGAAYLATVKASQDYSYGYRRTTILAALANAVILVVAAGFIAFESFEKLFSVHSMQTVPVMVVATIGIAVNAGCALLFLKGSKQDLNQRGAYLHLAYDAVISVGVVIGALIIHFTGAFWIDPVLGLLIVSVILYGTWGLLKDSVNLIIDAVPGGIQMAEVQKFLEKVEGVTEVHDLHIWAMSTHENCLTAHLVMPENTLWSKDGYADLGDELQSRFNIHHVTLQVEKDPNCSNNDCD